MITRKQIEVAIEHYDMLNEKYGKLGENKNILIEMLEYADQQQQVKVEPEAKVNFADIENGIIDKRYTEDWSRSGIINMDKVPELVASTFTQRKRMVQYIEALHKKFEEIIQKNNICPICYKANCGSDHK